MGKYIWDKKQRKFVLKDQPASNEGAGIVDAGAELANVRKANGFEANRPAIEPVRKVVENGPAEPTEPNRAAVTDGNAVGGAPAVAPKNTVDVPAGTIETVEQAKERERAENAAIVAEKEARVAGRSFATGGANGYAAAVTDGPTKPAEPNKPENGTGVGTVPTGANTTTGANGNAVATGASAAPAVDAETERLYKEQQANGGTLGEATQETPEDPFRRQPVGPQKSEANEDPAKYDATGDVDSGDVKEVVAPKESEMVTALRQQMGDKFVDEITSDPETWERYKAILEGQYQRVLDAQKNLPTDEQKARKEKYNMLNQAVSALAQAIGAGVNMYNAGNGPVGGAVEMADITKNANDMAEKSDKKYEDALKSVRDAQEKLDATIGEASAYKYKNKKEREALQYQREQDAWKREQAERKLDQEIRKYNDEYQMKLKKMDMDQQKLDKLLEKYDSDIRRNNAAASKSYSDSRGNKTKNHDSFRVGTKDVFIPKEKWSGSPENIARAYALLSPAAKKSIQRHIENSKSKTKVKISLTDPATAERQITEIMESDDVTTKEFMRTAIGQWLSVTGPDYSNLTDEEEKMSKEQLEKEYDNSAALEFVLGLTSDDPMTTKDFKSKTGGKDV